MHIYIYTCNVVSIYVFAYLITCLRICLYIHIYIYTYTLYKKTMYIFIIHCFKVRIRIR